MLSMTVGTARCMVYALMLILCVSALFWLIQGLGARAAMPGHRGNIEHVSLSVGVPRCRSNVERVSVCRCAEPPQ